MIAAALPTARPEEVGLSSERLGRISTLLRDKAASGHVPGGVWVVMRNGRVAHHEAFGVRDPASGDAMRTDGIFRIYSMSKAVVSVATMMLWEEGRFLLDDPVAKYLPEFADQKVLVERNGTVDYVPAARPSTVQDLLRHTSGLSYEFRGTGPVQKAYMDAKVYRRSQTNADQAATLGKLPLAFHPGARWEYSRATDVLGRLVEVLSGESLGTFLDIRILKPLGMTDSGFFVPEAQHGRLAGGFAKDPEAGTDVMLLDVRQKPSFESGGGGMVSTAMDYARFLQMLLDGGQGNGARLLGRKTVELMTADHLEPGVTGDPSLLIPGYGFGLGFAVRRQPGIAALPGSTGQYYWGGMAGTTFWVDPAERLHAVLMIQAPGQREYYRVVFRDMVYAALTD